MNFDAQIVAFRVCGCECGEMFALPKPISSVRGAGDKISSSASTCGELDSIPQPQIFQCACLAEVMRPARITAAN